MFYHIINKMVEILGTQFTKNLTFITFNSHFKQSDFPNYTNTKTVGEEMGKGCFIYLPF